MSNKLMQVFYGEDCLPYKDVDRVVHYPITGSAFLGASNTTEIRFYIDRIGSHTDTWVANSKLPNGKMGNEILQNEYDEELGEHYVVLPLSSFYTQAKGDLFISLNGFQGGVQITESDGVYSIQGIPTIQATGVIKIAINYATPLIDGDEVDVITLQMVLSAISDRVPYIGASDNVDIGEHLFIGQGLCGNSTIIPNSTTISQLYEMLPTSKIAILYMLDSYFAIKIGKYGDTYVYSGANLQLGAAFGGSTTNGGLTIYSMYSNPRAYAFADSIAQTYSNAQSYKVGDLVEQGRSLYRCNTPITYSGTPNMFNPSYWDLVTCASELMNRVNKSSSSEIVYGTDDTGNQTTYAIDSDLVGNGEVVRRESGTGTIVVGTPTAVNHATTKAYVDAKVSSAYIYKGSKTVSEINALNTSTLEIGWVYNVSNSGTITLGSIQVNAGDNIAWTGTGWDKLAGFIDLSGYVQKTQTIAGIDMQDNITTQELTDALVFMNNTTDIDYVMGD